MFKFKFKFRRRKGVEMSNNKKVMKVKEELPLTKEGLPKEAFAIVGDPHNPATWKLPHHKKSMKVAWDAMPSVVAAISLGGFQGERVKASPEAILAAAHHLAAHYRKADKPLPDALAVLV